MRPAFSLPLQPKVKSRTHHKVAKNTKCHEGSMGSKTKFKSESNAEALRKYIDPSTAPRIDAAPLRVTMMDSSVELSHAAICISNVRNNGPFNGGRCAEHAEESAAAVGSVEYFLDGAIWREFQQQYQDRSQSAEG